ncbi:MAG: hypothetical protein KGL13_08110 [Gammaproteobacteria bacterium]|nr:hypothetical protein [Gammaproteobacteria bacterium]MDE2346419.1 hypothetical protein [Gammaproteobacteria bacterium]
MKPSPIRELARHYASGELSFDEYRARRRKLVDGIASGLLNLEYGELSSAGRKRPYLLWSSAAMLLAISLAIGALAWKRHSRATITQNTVRQTIPDSGPALLHAFMSGNDWSDASLLQFLQRWKALSPSEQEAAYNSYLFPRLTAQLREQIASQKAVVDLDAGDLNQTDQAATHLAHLQQLATLLGMKTQN